jgi:ABC-type sugar transport system ATPase subunit
MSLPPATAPDVPLLRMAGVSKSFPGVRALHDVTLTLHAGEVLALLGENGAGKSTLIKVLAGAIAPDAGTIEIDGRPARIHDPVSARRAGVGVIYQEFNLVPAMTARENIFLGTERRRLGFVSARDEHRQARALFERIGVPIDPQALCRDLSVAQQQVVEIARALALQARIIVMDEPSAALSSREVENLLAIVRDLKSHGIGIIYVSHRLDEVFALADRATVLRDGEHVTTQPITAMTREMMIERLVGRTIEQEFPKRRAAIGATRLAVRELRRGKHVAGVSFDVRRGEVVALTGLVGAGRTETARLIFGADRADGGEIHVDGRLCRIRGPRDAIRAGICLLTEDRKTQGLVLQHSVQENYGLPNLRRFSRFGLLRMRRERETLDGYVRQLHIRLADPRQRAATLSGGNQQKVVLAKWLASRADVMIFDEPTRGIDVGAKYEIYQLINELAAQGKAVLMISSELPEVLGMADRILVMHDGRITGEITDVAAATQEQVLELAVA